jgi:maltooligosyltrehalose trehalohydrolase
LSTFEVWAPFAERVEVLINPDVGARHASPLRPAKAERLPMRQDGSGWWTVDASSPLPAGRGAGGEVALDYAFVIDGEGPFPDPRSPWQPGGVDAPSRTVDHAAFAWQHAEWPHVALADAVIYELHIGTFTPGGSFDSAIERLDHLVDLGVTHVEIMPVAHFSGARGWGYDGVDLYAPHQAYGGPSTGSGGAPEALKRFVDACHGKGLRVLLDVVYNHLGPAGNYTERFGPYFTDRYHTPWGKAINYDQEYADEVRRWVIDNAIMWLRDYRFDGLRLDAVHAILDQSAVHILEQMAAEKAALEHPTGRHYDLIAESDLNDPKLVRSPERGGYGLDGAWSDDFHHALHALLTGETAGYYADFGRFEHLAGALQRVYVYDGRYSEYRRRTHGRPVGDIPATRFVFASQNHDQVGNRAVGERLVHLAGHERAKIAAAVLIMAPGVPLLFQGEEWAASTPFQYFTAHEDPDLGRAVSEGRRREFAAFGWDPAGVPDPQDPATFERSRLDWDEIAREPHADMLSWYRDLIALRRASPGLRDGDLTKVQIAYDDDAGWLRMSRGLLTLILNLGSQACTVEIVAPSSIRLASHRDIEAAGASAVLPPDSVVILEANT